jgi:hypothetical protein
MNCKVCARAGSLACSSCSNGKVRCPDCLGAGRKERWLDLVETTRSDVQLEPDGEQTCAFKWGSDGTVASSREIESDAKVVAEFTSRGPVSKDAIATVVGSDWLEANWKNIQPKLLASERVRAQTIWVLEVPSIELAYSLGGAAPTVIAFEGRRMLAPPPSIDGQFAARARKLQTTKYVVLALSLAVPVAYLVRGRYFWNGWLLGIAACAAFLGACVYGFLRESTLGALTARRWAGAVAVGALLVCGLAVGAEPSVRAARRYLSAGQTAKARAELLALGAQNEPSRAQVWADLALAEALASNDLPTVAQLTGAIPAGFSQRAIATQRLYDQASQAILRDLSAQHPAQASALLALVTPTIQASPSASEFTAKLGELQARAHDEEFAQCSQDECRWAAAKQAVRVAPSTERTQRMEGLRSRIVDELTARTQSGEPALARIARLDSVLRLGRALEQGEGDRDLNEKARAAVASATDERGKIAMLGADSGVVAALLGVAAAPGAHLLTTVVSSVAVFCSMRGGKCTGVYIVGSEKGARALNDSNRAGTTTRLLSQSLGRTVSLPDPPKPSGDSAPTTSKWRENGVTILARWSETQLIELRVGDATP